MLTRRNSGWSELDEMMSTMNQLRSYMDRVFEDPNAAGFSGNRAPSLGAGGWPRANLTDAGASFVLSADVPGLSEKDLTLSLNQEVLTISGVRDVDPPEGYSVHRQERPAVSFSRSFALPCRIDPDKTTALVKDGVLTVTIPKAAEAMPRQIQIKAS